MKEICERSAREKVFIIHPRFSPDAENTCAHYCQEQSGTFAEGKKAWIDGQNGGRDFLTFIALELIKGGEVIIFIWKGERKGGNYS